MERELVWSDEKFIEQTKQGIEQALKAQQKLLDTWNALKIGPCPDLFKLIHIPQRVYAQATIPKSDFSDIMTVPVPNELYIAAREAKRCIQVGRRELWSVIDGKTVVLNQDRAEALINSHCVWSKTPAGKEFANHVKQYKESGKYLYEKLQTMLGMQTAFSVPYTMVGKGFAFINDLEIEATALQEMVERIDSGI